MNTSSPGAEHFTRDLTPVHVKRARASRERCVNFGGDAKAKVFELEGHSRQGATALDVAGAGNGEGDAQISGRISCNPTAPLLSAKMRFASSMLGRRPLFLAHVSWKKYVFVLPQRSANSFLADASARPMK